MTPRPLLVVPVFDLESGEKTVSWTLPESWLMKALDGTEATPRGTAEVNVTLSKSGRQVVVRGKVIAPLAMPCARSMDPVEVDIASDIFLLLSPPAAGAAHDKRRPGAARRPATQHRGAGRKSGKAAEVEPPLTEDDAAEDAYDGEQVVLDSFIREFILLDLPMFPVRSDLRSEDEPAIEPAPSAPANAKPLDPRLAPLAALASRLRDTKE